MHLDAYTESELQDELKRRAEQAASASARDKMPTDEAEIRAALHPCPGDRWTEMFSSWFHIEDVSSEHVLVRIYVGPCHIRPEEAKETHRISRAGYAEWIMGNAHYTGNDLWVATAGGAYPTPPILGGEDRMARLKVALRLNHDGEHDTKSVSTGGSESD